MKMPTESAKLVYLLQHCTPKIRYDLEHFSQNEELGYRLARETLFNEYGQPHIVAYSCEQKLLSSSRLKAKDPAGLKALAVLMEKCLTMLQDVGDFATLNSLGTIQQLTEKLPDETQKEWVKWSFQFLKRTEMQAKFPQLVEFVRAEADEVNSLYGRALYGAHRKREGHPAVNSRRTPSFNAATVNRRP